MFDLDDAVAGWRRNLQKVGVKWAEDLDELEGHLRDEVEDLARSGLPQEEAFREATRRLGDAQELKHEFSKVGDQRSRLLELIEREVRAMSIKSVTRVNLLTTLLLFIGFSGLFGWLGATWKAVHGMNVPALGFWEAVIRPHFPPLRGFFLMYAVAGLALGLIRLEGTERKGLLLLGSLIPAFLLCPKSVIDPVFSCAGIALVLFPLCVYGAVHAAIERRVTQDV